MDRHHRRPSCRTWRPVKRKRHKLDVDLIAYRLTSEAGPNLQADLAAARAAMMRFCETDRPPEYLSW